MLLLDVVPPNTGSAMVFAVNAPVAQTPHKDLHATMGACTLVVKSLSAGVAGLIPSASNILRAGDSALQIFEP